MDAAIRSIVADRRTKGLLWIAAVVLLVVLIVAYTERSGYARALTVFLLLAASIAAVLDLRIGVAVLLLIAVTDGFLKGWLGSGTFSLLMKDYFLVLCVACWLSGRPWRTPSSSWHHPIRLPMIVLSLWVVAQLFNPQASGQHTAALAGARAWLIWFGVFFVGHDMLGSLRMVRLTVTWVLVLAGLCGAYGILQYIFGFGFLGEASLEAMERVAVYGWVTAAGQKVGRVYGTTVHPGVFGTFMAQAILLGIGAILGSQRLWQRLLFAGCMVIATAGLVLSGTRTAMAAAAVGWLAMLVVWRSPRLPLLAAVVLLPGILVAGNLTDRVAYQRGTGIWTRRVYTFERVWEPLSWAVNTAAERPLGHGISTGVGVPHVMLGRAPTSGMFVENDLGRAVVELGFPGLFVYGWLLWVCLRSAFGACAATRGTPAFGLALSFLGCIMMTEVALSTGAALYFAPGALVFWTCVAAQSSLTRDAPKSQQSDGGPPASDERARQPVARD